MLIILCGIGVCIILLCDCHKIPFLHEKIADRSWSFLDGKIEIYADLYAANAEDETFSNWVIYHNDVKEFSDNKGFYLITANGKFPMVRALEDDFVEILLAIRYEEGDKVLQLITNGKILRREDMLPLFNTWEDLDDDNIPEFATYQTDEVPYCLSCDSVYYNPLKIYELSKDGIVFDKEATRLWIEQYYGCFEGFNPRNDILVQLQKPVSHSVKKD